MLIFRLILMLLLVASVLCFAMAVGTGQVAWRRRGMLILKWTLVAALGFTAVMILELVAKVI